eukprot:13503366-Heterocapsa_arctica.AAC.1
MVIPPAGLSVMMMFPSGSLVIGTMGSWFLCRMALFPGLDPIGAPTDPLGTGCGRIFHGWAVCGKPSCRAFPAEYGMGSP